MMVEGGAQNRRLVEGGAQNRRMVYRGRGSEQEDGGKKFLTQL